jgi:hypothetical protein
LPQWCAGPGERTSRYPSRRSTIQSAKDVDVGHQRKRPRDDRARAVVEDGLTLLPSGSRTYAPYPAWYRLPARFSGPAATTAAGSVHLLTGGRGEGDVEPAMPSRPARDRRSKSPPRTLPDEGIDERRRHRVERAARGESASGGEVVDRPHASVPAQVPKAASESGPREFASATSSPAARSSAEDAPIRPLPITSMRIARR